MRRVVRVTAVVVTAMLTASVACRRNAQPADSAAGADTSLVVALERGACRGRCPEYRVELFADGKVLFNGTKNVAVTGAASGIARVNDVGEIMRLISESGFAALDTAFTYGNAACGQYFPDLPMIVLWAKVGSVVRKVQYDPGCQAAPAVLRTIAARVDSVAGTATWIQGKGAAK